MNHPPITRQRSLASHWHTARQFARILVLAMLLCTGSIARAEDPPKPTSTDSSDVSISEEAKTAISGGLKYLKSTQQTNGGWSANGNHQAAITGYALIAFMASGSLPGEGENGAVVQRGVDFLVSCARPDGYMASPIGQSNMYDHGVATLALAEVYGQVQSKNVRPALDRAVKLILKCQNAQGGWRYSPQMGDADISVTVIQLCALRAAKNAGFDVPQSTIDLAVKYVHACRDDQTGGFLYQPRSGSAGFSRSAAAIYSLQVCGLYSDPVIQPAATYLFDHIGREGAFPTYGHFYAGPAMYMIGGNLWKKWYAKVSDELLSRKRTEGDRTWWDRDGRDGDSQMPVYYTAVNTTLLALPLGYVPLYQR